MSTTELHIVPVTLNLINHEESLFVDSSQTLSGSIFFNGVNKSTFLTISSTAWILQACKIFTSFVTRRIYQKECMIRQRSFRILLYSTSDSIFLFTGTE